jgi:phosphate uptake regulator
MQKDSVSAFVAGEVKLASTVVERDEEVNRTYFLLVRVVRAALTDSSLAHKLSVTPIDCLDYRLLGSFIEDFGDHSVALAQSASDESTQFPGGFSKAIGKAGSAIHSMYDSAVEAVLTRNLKLVPSVERLREESDQSIRASERFLSGMNARLISKATSGIGSLRAMAEVNVDIADLAVTR